MPPLRLYLDYNIFIYAPSAEISSCRNDAARRHAMDTETNEDILNLIDLGVASVETQGFGLGGIDKVGEQNTAMISDD